MFRFHAIFFIILKYTLNHGWYVLNVEWKKNTKKQMEFTKSISPFSAQFTHMKAFTSLVML